MEVTESRGKFLEKKCWNPVPAVTGWTSLCYCGISHPIYMYTDTQNLYVHDSFLIS